MVCVCTIFSIQSPTKYVSELIIEIWLLLSTGIGLSIIFSICIRAEQVWLVNVHFLGKDMVWAKYNNKQKKSNTQKYF